MKTIQKIVFLISILLLATNAQAGRWLSRDPIEHMERDPHPWDLNASNVELPNSYQQQANLYTFVSNNPINNIDPLGLWQFTVGAGFYYGGIISFGYNGGRANIQASAGLAMGLKANYNHNDLGAGPMKTFAIKAGLGASAEIKAGPFANADVGLGTFGQADTCNKWQINSSIQLEAGLKLPGTPFHFDEDGVAGYNTEGTGFSGDKAGFFKDTEGESIGGGGLLFLGGTAGASW